MEFTRSLAAREHRGAGLQRWVVAVDDGSPDRSIDILQAYAARDRRLQIARQANAGLGAARNVGAQHACLQHSPWATTAD